jgi:uncharacterized protein YdeI (YjbR/CyaY-like superfamily)
VGQSQGARQSDDQRLHLAQHRWEPWRSAVHRCECRGTAERRRKSGRFRDVALEPDSEKREIEIPSPLQKALGAKLTQKLKSLSFTHKKEFVVWYSEAKKEDTRARRVEKMKVMLSAGKVIS